MPPEAGWTRTLEVTRVIDTREGTRKVQEFSCLPAATDPRPRFKE